MIPVKMRASFSLFLTITALSFIVAVDSSADDRVRPYEADPQYWQYKGEPVLLLGGSKTDHIFLLDDLESHLDEIVAAGGNYVRCTMSQREGAALKPHRLLPDNTFDLDQWNDDYWNRFDRCLELCAARNIIVQIELWDRFDYSQKEWAASAWRPANNVNYTGEETGFADAYPEPAHRDKQPFFFTVPGIPQYNKRYARILSYQEAFAEKVLQHALPHGNVLYCISNEGSAPAEWSAHWAQLIHDRARQAGVSAFVTEMLDGARLEPVVSRPDLYTFVEGSKVLGPRRQAWAPKGEGQWQMTLDTFAAMGDAKRPINAVKIITNEDAEQDVYSRQKLWRGLMAGMAAIRFHRAPAGSALNDSAKACIRAARLVEAQVKFWELAPRLDLLSDRDVDEAYLRATPGHGYVMYFPNGGEVTIDLSRERETLSGYWIEVGAGEQREVFAVDGGAPVSIAAPGKADWALVLTP
ncbi:MAG: hypothetical protein AMXMBFR82_15870 [Candidatus Hydrogenedentota bacterium]